MIPSLLKEKPDTVVIHVGSNNITHRIFDDCNAAKLADEIIDIGKMCTQYGVKDAIFSSIFVKNSIKLSKMISQVNETVTKKCEENEFHFVSNDNILRKHLCKDGVHLTDEGTNIFAGNIVDYISHFIVKNFEMRQLAMTNILRTSIEILIKVVLRTVLRKRTPT